MPTQTDSTRSGSDHPALPGGIGCRGAKPHGNGSGQPHAECLQALDFCRVRPNHQSNGPTVSARDARPGPMEFAAAIDTPAELSVSMRATGRRQQKLPSSPQLIELRRRLIQRRCTMTRPSIKEALEQNRRRLMQIDGVVGVAVGALPDDPDQRCIVVYASIDQWPPALPRVLEGYRVIMQKSSGFHKL